MTARYESGIIYSARQRSMLRELDWQPMSAVRLSKRIGQVVTDVSSVLALRQRGLLTGPTSRLSLTSAGRRWCRDARIAELVEASR